MVITSALEAENQGFVSHRLGVHQHVLVHVMACPVGMKVVRKIISASTGLVSTTIFGRVCRFMGYALDSEAFCESR